MRYRYVVAAFLYMGLIWYMSAQPGDSGMVPPLPYNLDKLAHALEYAILSGLLARGFGAGKSKTALATVAAVLYGLVDEYHQLSVPGRDASLWDWTADMLGAFFGVLMADLNIIKRRHGAEDAARQERTETNI